MYDKRSLRFFTVGTPATYRIVVRGRLDRSWSEQLGGIAVQSAPEVDDAPATTLIGKLVDQAALLGVLNGLYGLGFPLLSVECTCVELPQKV